MTEDNLDSSMEEIRCTEMLCLCDKTYRCPDLTTNRNNFSSKSLSKHVLEEIGDGPLQKNCSSPRQKINKLRQQTEVSKQTITLMQHTNKVTKGFFTFTLKELQGVTQSTLNLSIDKMEKKHFPVSFLFSILYLLSNFFKF